MDSRPESASAAGGGTTPDELEAVTGITPLDVVDGELLPRRLP